MEIKNERLILVLTFFVALFFRLAFVFRIQHFSSDSAYFNLRHSEYILHNFFPLINDSMSYGGNIIVDTHLFHYFLAVWDVVLPQFLVYKLIPAILASSIVFIVYVLAKQITKDTFSAFFAALLAAFIPTYIQATLNQISILSIYIPVLLLLFSSFIEVKKRKILFIILSIILVVLQPLNLLVISTFMIYGIILLSESVTIKKREKESIAFFASFFILLNLLLFRNIYFEQGLATVWKNFPIELSGQLFQNFNLFTTITAIGVVPLIFGILGFMLIKKQTKILTLFKAMLISIFSLLLLKLIPFEEGILILAVILCITSAITLQKIMEYLDITKVAKHTKILSYIIVILAVTSLLIPSTIVAREIIEEGVTEQEIEALDWIKEETPPERIVLGNVNEGNLILYIANRTNVIDTQFFYAENRIFDVNTVYETESMIKAIRSLDKYTTDYIYLSDKSRQYYGIEEIAYIQDETCFKEVFRNDRTTVYKFAC
jgi:hypothetical protein